MRDRGSLGGARRPHCCPDTRPDAPCCRLPTDPNIWRAAETFRLQSRIALRKRFAANTRASITAVALAVTACLGVFSAHALAAPLELQLSLDNPSPNANDLFGQAVSLSGGIALVGASLDGTTGSGSGQAYLFDTATGTLLHTLANPTPAVNDFFGLRASLSGNLALVGTQNDDTSALNAGTVYLFNATTGILLRTFLDPGASPIASDNFGHAVAVSGNQVLISANLDDAGATNSGAAYLFDATTGALLKTFLNPTPAGNDQFGTEVALLGNLALIAAPFDDAGATNSGAVYLFDTTTGTLLRTFTNPTPASNDNFGTSVALSGTRVLIGATQDDTLGFNEGAAYLYDLATGNLVSTLLIPSQNGDSEFLGQSSALSDSYALVGAAFDNSAALDAGGAYLFDAMTGALQQEIFDPQPFPGDRFGFAVALDGSNALIGAQTDRVGTVPQGSVFYFAPQALPEPPTLAVLAVVLATSLVTMRRRSTGIAR